MHLFDVTNPEYSYQLLRHLIRPVHHYALLHSGIFQ